MTSFTVAFTAPPQVDVTATADRVCVWFDDVALSVFVSQGRPLAASLRKAADDLERKCPPPPKPEVPTPADEALRQIAAIRADAAAAHARQVASAQLGVWL
jgi:hypothetical protein